MCEVSCPSTHLHSPLPSGDYTVSVDGALGPLGSRLHCALESGVREAGRVLAAVDAAEKTKSKV